MKKIIFYISVCSIVCSAGAMCSSKDLGTSVVKKSHLMSLAEREQLQLELRNAVHDYVWDCGRVKTILDRGADPNADCYLHDAAAESNSKLINLLLLYGADPHKKDHQLYEPIDYAHILETLRPLVRAGVNISEYEEIARAQEKDGLTRGLHGDVLLYALMQGGNPNVCTWQAHVPILHYAIEELRLSDIIALVRFGARLDFGQASCPLAFACQCLREMKARLKDIERRAKRLAERAQFGSSYIGTCIAGPELDVIEEEYDQLLGNKTIVEAIIAYLGAIRDHRLNSCGDYTVEQYLAMGISNDSAQCLAEAAHEVDLTIERLALDDISYRYGDYPLLSLVLDREVGRLSKKQ